ncbi:hypothetical protein KC669_02260 [Candidatus Dojkabacteria bacterium]|uniref:DUF2207 domain-containing protein n=1 Tax=Candidatus Dojkabacteria bacterium TaxID=2099670 RepID=A0A955L9X9_9BACT|nr:hypothetical protein [Candidatus Dojkabacteria bacterium]
MDPILTFILIVLLLSVVFLIKTIAKREYSNTSQNAMWGDILRVGSGKNDLAIKLTSERILLLIILLLLVHFIFTISANERLLGFFPPLIALICVGIGYYIREVKKRKIWSRHTIVPDSKIPEDLNVYEIGMLNDGTFGQEDIFATFAALRLGYIDKDLTDLKPYRKFEDKSLQEINRYLNPNTKQGQNENSRVQFSTGIYAKMVRDKYFAYDPRAVFAFFLTVAGFCLLFNSLLDEFADNRFYDLNFITFSFAIAFFILGISAPFFHENFERVLPIRLKLEGLKMYLKTADYYRIKHDEKRFEEIIPYMLALRLNINYIDDMIEYIDRKTEMA